MNKETLERIRKFTTERDWEKFHTGANLAKGLAIEVSEVLELFLWQDEPTSLDDLKDELADVLVYVAYLCDKYNLDMDEIVNNKMTKNEKKYPVEKCYGKSTKYNKLQLQSFYNVCFLTKWVLLCKIYKNIRRYIYED